MSDKTRIYSAIATAIIVIIVIVWMNFDHIVLKVNDREWPPRHDSEITIDDEYAEILDLPRPRLRPSEDPAKAYNETPADNKAESAPETGMETVDQGTPGEAPEPVVQDRPSSVKVEKKEKPKKQGPSAEELKKQEQQRLEEQARRKATRQTQNAFRNSGKNATTNNGRNEGEAGNPKGSASSVNGRGTGRVGGGWSMPAYNAVPSTVTGTVEMMVKIDREGRVKSVTFQGGDAPAATDRAVRAACEREVRSRRFTRPDSNAPEESTAYITYRFR